MYLDTQNHLNDKGPISVTIHVRNNTRQIRDLVGSLEALSAASPKMSTHVDVHLVIDSFDRQFNMWRNIARLFARTDYVMILDVDFYICTDIRSAVRGNQAIMAKLRDGLAAIVIPAFEYAKYSDGMDPTVFPRNKQVRCFICRREIRFCSRRSLGSIGSREIKAHWNVSCHLGAWPQQY